MEIKLEEHTIPKQTRWGTVQRSLNQHIVSIKTDETAGWLHCGYVGMTAFLPLSGFPNELVPEVARLCGEHLRRDVAYVKAPPTMSEIQSVLDLDDTPDGDDE